MSEFDEDDTRELVSPKDPSSRFFAPPPPAVKVEFGARSHPGKVRTNNEDQLIVVRRSRARDILMTSLPESWLRSSEQCSYVIAVADGMGGAAFGEVASSLAVASGWELGFDEIKWPMKITSEEVQEILDKFDAYGQLIHRSLLHSIEEDPRLAGMGTTLTAAYTIGLDAFIGHVGDSRAYLFHDNTLRQLTRDHTMAQQFIDMGILSAGSLEARRLGHILTNCLGANSQGIRVDVRHLQLAYGDRLLLCTDGLTDMVGDDQVADILRERANPDAACDALLELALEHGGTDNITMVLARYDMPERDQTAVAHEKSGHDAE
jgi:protein phosphatase